MRIPFWHTRLAVPIYSVLFFVIALVVPAPGFDKAVAATTSLRADSEIWYLPDGEQTGMVGLSASYPVNSAFRVGFGSWMAVAGEKGGLIMLGLDGSFAMPLAQKTDIDTGIFIGAGGGKTGYMLTGGGLMIRSFAAIRQNIAEQTRIGGGISYVSFPDGGAIHSWQPFLSLTVPVESSLVSGWAAGSGNQFVFQEEPKRHRLSVVARRLFVDPAATNDLDRFQGDLSLLGIEWRTFLDDCWYIKIETEGAAGGGSMGYMQILGGTGLQIPLGSGFSVDTGVSVGGAGGGHVRTGGGLLLDLLAGVHWNMTPHFSSSVMVGPAVAPDGGFNAATVLFSAGYQRSNQSRVRDRVAPMHPAVLRIRTVTQRYMKASELWRTHHVDRDADVLGLQFDYFVADHVYLSGQGVAAYSGGAGAYMAGLVGPGLRQPVTGNFFIDAEVLAGAAGGGGMAMGSGLVWQANGGIGYDISPALSLQLSGGRMEAVNGPFKANVISFSLDWKMKSYLN